MYYRVECLVRMLGYGNGIVTDEVLNVMADSIRRRLLFYIYGQGQDGRDLPLSNASIPEFGSDHVEILLYHIHLPKLADAGYVTWDKDAQAISKGPKWTEIEPLLRLTYGHLNELPSNLRGSRTKA